MAINIDTAAEIARADALISNTTILLADSYLMGYQHAIFEYTNVLSIVKIAREYLNYSLSNIVDNTTLVNAMNVIREYLDYGTIKSTVDYFLLYSIVQCEGETNDSQINPKGHSIDISDSVPSVDPETKTEQMDFKKYKLPIDISEVDKILFVMPFDVADIDVDSITMTVGGDNPKYTTTGSGYHMEGTNLHWHGDYPLRYTYDVIVKYVLNN